MDEIWERAVEAALDGQTDRLATRALILDGAVNCVQARLPPPSLLERFQNLHHLSIANIGVSLLEQFPRLGNLQKLILSDNRISVGLEFLVEAGLDSLHDLDLSNNRIQFVEDLAPLAKLKLVSLDLYECPVTRVKDYRSRVFALIKTLKFLDKTDVEGNERHESDDEDDEEDEEEDEEGDEEDPGSGEVDGDERTEALLMSNGHTERFDGVVDMDEDEESDAEDDESEQVTGVNGTGYRTNGFCLQAVNGEELEEDDGDDSESGEEIDEEEVGEDNDVVEVHEIEDSDNEEDGVDDEEDEDDEDEEEVDNDDRGLRIPGSTDRLMNVGEIDGHEQGDDDEDGDGETGEDGQRIEDDEDFGDEDDDGEEEDEESGEGYLVQPVSQVDDHDATGSDMDPINEDNDSDEEEDVEDDLLVCNQSLPSSSRPKRKRDGDDDDDDGGDSGDDGDGDDDDGDDDDDDGVDDEEG